MFRSEEVMIDLIHFDRPEKWFQLYKSVFKIIEVNLSLVSGSINTSSKSLIFRFTLCFVNYDVINNYSVLFHLFSSSETTQSSHVLYSGSSISGPVLGALVEPSGMVWERSKDRQNLESDSDIMTSSWSLSRWGTYDFSLIYKPGVGSHRQWIVTICHNRHKHLIVHFQRKSLSFQSPKWQNWLIIYLIYF